MLAHRLRLWASINSTLVQRLVFAGDRTLTYIYYIPSDDDDLVHVVKLPVLVVVALVPVLAELGAVVLVLLLDIHHLSSVSQ